jgi:5'-deoxynucleotidase YfbR-like HD superfamily hydrolase
MRHRLEALYDAGEVKRLHTVPILREHHVAEHVYGALMWLMELVDQVRPAATAAGLSISREHVLIWLMYHDAPELITGDIPAPTKRALAAHDGSDSVPPLDTMEAEAYSKLFNITPPTLNEWEMKLAKTCDYLDLAMCCVRERQMGNGHPTLFMVFQNAMTYVSQCGLPRVQFYERWMWDLWHGEDR